MGSNAGAKDVTLDFIQSLTLQDTEAPCQLTLTLTDQAPTRIGINALLDLSKIQAALPAALADISFAEGCNAEIDLDTIDAVSNGQEISVQGRFGLDTFKCNRALGQTPERQEKTVSFALFLSTTAFAIERDQCVFFGPSDLELTLADQRLISDDVTKILQDTRAIFLKAGDAILSKTPICPTCHRNWRLCRPGIIAAARWKSATAASESRLPDQSTSAPRPSSVS